MPTVSENSGTSYRKVVCPESSTCSHSNKNCGGILNGVLLEIYIYKLELHSSKLNKLTVVYKSIRKVWHRYYSGLVT